MIHDASPDADSRNVGCISVVVPVWRESPALFGLLRVISKWQEVLEVIVVVADETPEFCIAAEAAGAVCIGAGRPNRGRQMNAGARRASGEWLLFHHADSELQRPHVQALAALGNAVGGAFHRKFDLRHPHCRWIEPIERWRNRHFGALFGDQSIFVRRDHFQKLGGFADIPLMEDIEFSKRLRRSGPLALLDPPIASSARRHAACGAWRTTLANATLILLYKLGVPPDRLHALYYGIRKPSESPTPVITLPNEN
jgi:rSAM/selenodomain-associated transferase 2